MAVTRMLQRQELITYLKDVKAAGTGGGASLNGAFRARVLNTQEGDTSFCSLSSNQFTLQPGTYNIFCRSPFAMNNGHDPQFTKIRLRNITDTVTTLPGDNGQVGDADTSVIMVTWLSIMGTFTLTTAKTFEIQYQCTTTDASTNMLGGASNFGENEVYTQVRINKLA